LIPLDCNLAGTGVLVTRAAHQAEGLCRLITELGGRPLRFPTIEISAPEQTEKLYNVLTHIETYDMAIFISVNAVAWGLKLLARGRLPAGVRTAAVGLSTARALAEAGQAVAVVPKQGFDSEALLAAPEMSASAVAGKKILIFRGQGGRALLGKTLAERGALVEYAEVYRRRCPEHAGDLSQAAWIRDLDVTTATSNTILDNLLLLFGDTQRECLLATPLIVISERMCDHARALGWRWVTLAAGPDDRSIVDAICQWSASR